MPTATDEDAVREIVEDVFRQRGSMPFTYEDAERIERLDAQLQGMLQDRSLGRIMNGPLWMSGASVVDGTITADKIIVDSIDSITINTGDLNVTGDIIAAPTYPSFTGPRIIINSTAISGYNASNVNTFALRVDGSGFIGTGLSAMTWTAGGALTVPAAAIGSLTIAQVGSGVFTGNYDAGTGRVRAGTALQRVELTSAGLQAYNSAGSQTFSLSASDGSMDMVGLFTMRNATSGARVEISNVGIRGYNSGGTQTFGMTASNGSGFIGSGSTISWNTAGTVTIPGSLLVGNTITADKLNVSTLSAISANMGTITAGSITAGTVSASTITTGTLSYGSGGTVNGGGSVTGTFGGLNLANLTVTGAITIGSGGYIQNATGDRWDENGITLVSTGSFGDAIKWRVSGIDKGSLYADTNRFYMQYTTTGAGVQFEANKAVMWGGGGSSVNRVEVDSNGGTTNHYFCVYMNNLDQFWVQNGDVGIHLGDGSGSKAFRIATNGSTNRFGIASNGAMGVTADATVGISTGWSTLGSVIGRWAIHNTSFGLVGYVPVYNSIT